MPRREHDYFKKRREKFVRMWMANATTEEIATATGISKANIGQQAAMLRKKGLDLPRRTPRGEGMTATEIAALQEIVKEATKKALQDALESKNGK